MIKIENLTKTFHAASVNPFGKSTSVRALRGVSLSVGEGEAVALVGRNGAGKTTLLKIISALILADGGRAEVCGIDVAKNSAGAKRVTGLVSGDERSFYWRLSGRQNLSLFGALYDIPASKLRVNVERMLESAGLADCADLPVRTYSSGMKQRLSLARGMLHEPRALLMDEPNRSADPSLQERFMKYVRDEIIGRRKCSVIFATHNIEEAVFLGCRVAVMEKGEVVYDGKPGGAAQIREMLSGFDADPGGTPLKWN